MPDRDREWSASFHLPFPACLLLSSSCSHNYGYVATLHNSRPCLCNIWTDSAKPNQKLISKCATELHKAQERIKRQRGKGGQWLLIYHWNSTTIYYLKLKFMIKLTIAGFTKLLMICAVTQLYRLCFSCRPTVGSWANVISIRKLPQLETLPSHWCPFLCLRLQLTNRRIYIHIYTPHIRRKKRRILRSFSRRTRPPWKFLRCFLLFFSARYIFISFVNWKLLKRVYQKFVQM